MADDLRRISALFDRAVQQRMHEEQPFLEQIERDIFEESVLGPAELPTNVLDLELGTRFAQIRRLLSEQDVSYLKKRGFPQLAKIAIAVRRKLLTLYTQECRNDLDLLWDHQRSLADQAGYWDMAELLRWRVETLLMIVMLHIAARCYAIPKLLPLFDALERATFDAIAQVVRWHEAL